jgi:membrane dipeptidase
MKRRRFLAAAGALAAFPRIALPQAKPARFADMHAHLGFRPLRSYRESMAEGGMLLVAEKIVPDGGLIRLMGNKFRATREAKPGELRRYYELGAQGRRAGIRKDNLAEITSLAALDKALEARTPGVVLASEGADFLEGDLAYLDKARAHGVVHLQIVHYYGWSGIGDISTEPPVFNGLSPFGKELVTRCNQLGMLIDVAHCSNVAMEQVLGLSSKPILYSHGHVTSGQPSHTQNGALARAIHLPVAKKIAAQGGVVGLWPEGNTYGNLALMADGIARTADSLGAQGVGIGSDMHGLPRTVMPSYAEFAELEGELGKRGLKQAEIEGILGGNYIRVLREAMKT